MNNIYQYLQDNDFEAPEIFEQIELKFYKKGEPFFYKMSRKEYIILKGSHSNLFSTGLAYSMKYKLSKLAYSILKKHIDKSVNLAYVEYLQRIPKSIKNVNYYFSKQFVKEWYPGCFMRFKPHERYPYYPEKEYEDMKKEFIKDIFNENGVTNGKRPYPFPITRRFRSGFYTDENDCIQYYSGDYLSVAYDDESKKLVFSNTEEYRKSEKLRTKYEYERITRMRKSKVMDKKSASEMKIYDSIMETPVANYTTEELTNMFNKMTPEDE